METNEEGGAPQVSESEQEAMRLGWEPEDKWHGKPEDWVDADSFLRRGREINSVLKKTLKQRDSQLADVQRQLAAVQGTVAELAEYRTQLEKKVYDSALADLKAQLKAARVDGDVERAADVEEAIDDMKAAAPKPATKAPPAAPVEPPEFKAWKERNNWYNPDSNPKMVAYADGVAIHIIQRIQQQEQRQPSSQEVLAQVDEAVRDMFPQAFSKPAASMVEGGSGSSASSGTGSRSSAKGFSSLPAEAKAQFERFYSAGYYVDMKTKKPLPKAEAQAEYFKDY